MDTLHLLNRSPQADGVYRDLREAFGEHDQLLLIEDGCYAAVTAASVALQGFGGRVAVLEEDAISRGLGGHLDETITVVDLAGFVDLTERFQRSMSWF